MDKVIIKCALISCIINQINCNPIKIENGQCETLYGIPVEDNMNNNVKYPDAEFIVPLFFDKDAPPISPMIPPSDPVDGQCNAMQRLGYAPVGALRSQLMPIEDFMKNNCLPDNVHFKLMSDAKPIFKPQELDKNINPVVIP